ncbi:hypothetical protein [Cognataquiflexum rubidum]|uniref:hypothetical protein n=1 Tax=Cognataquiflexum rubidum TaxID=2922273 RepID=UPI001F141A4D|nr:hypothetical protein [Cognataquiflexum rubidum]MCH6236488.1 hypothetical protein [Cognataquiflexum rubidum]
MKKSDKITLLFDYSKSITFNYSLYPILTSKNATNFTYSNGGKFDLNKDKNEHIVIFAKYFGNLNFEQQEKLIFSLKNKYKKVCFFDDLDGSEIQFFKFFDHFDMYFKKQLYSDLSFYTKKFNGNKYFVDYYSSIFPVEVNSNSKYNGQYQGDHKNLDKLEISWNIGVGTYFSSYPKLLRILFPIFGPKYSGKFLGKFPRNFNPQPNRINKCQARFGFNPQRKHVDIQRKVFLEIIEGNKLFLAGKLDSKQYQNEIKQVDAVLSPFGFGEVCFRDFEAILSGAVLIKPDMSHITTWPDVYKPMETYMPISWDGADLIQKVDGLLSNERLLNQLRKQAFQELNQAYLHLDKKVKSFQESILS